jgi:hypothetical protein
METSALLIATDEHTQLQQCVWGREREREGEREREWSCLFTTRLPRNKWFERIDLSASGDRSICGIVQVISTMINQSEHRRSKLSILTSNGGAWLARGQMHRSHKTLWSFSNKYFCQSLGHFVALYLMQSIVHAMKEASHIDATCGQISMNDL